MARAIHKARSPLKRLGTRKTLGVTKAVPPRELAVKHALFEELKRHWKKGPKMRLLSNITRQDKLRRRAASDILVGKHAKAMKSLKRAIAMVPKQIRNLLAEKYGAPLLSSKLRITEPFTVKALEAYKDKMDLQLLATVILDRICCKSCITVEACLQLGFNLMLARRDKALILFQHACEIGPTAFDVDALECLHDVLVRMEKMEAIFDFDCFLPLLHLATQWAYTCGKEHAATARQDQREARPFNLALKLYAKHRVKHWDNKGTHHAKTFILYFLHAEPRNGHYSTFHFTDTAGNFREDWYSPEVAHFLAELSQDLSKGGKNHMIVPKIWQQDAQGRTPLYMLVENLEEVPLGEFVQMGLLDYFMERGACLCTCDQRDKMRACHLLDLKLRDACPVPAVSLRCLAAKACRRYFPQRVMDQKLPHLLALWTKVH